MADSIEATRGAKFLQTVWKHGWMEDGRQVGAPLAISRQKSAPTSHWAGRPLFWRDARLLCRSQVDTPGPVNSLIERRS